MSSERETTQGFTHIYVSDIFGSDPFLIHEDEFDEYKSLSGWENDPEYDICDRKIFEPIEDYLIRTDDLEDDGTCWLYFDQHGDYIRWKKKFILSRDGILFFHAENMVEK